MVWFGIILVKFQNVDIIVTFKVLWKIIVFVNGDETWNLIEESEASSKLINFLFYFLIKENN